MVKDALLAISPLDGRYQAKMAELRPIFSEYGLIKFRIFVEIRWLEALAGKLPEIPSLSSQAKKILNEIIENFSAEDAQQIKKIETEINHDVKAVEYFLKERMANHPELNQIKEFVHFGCTSEDINNLAYGLMLKTARQQCILPPLNHLILLLKKYAHAYANLSMLARTHGQPASPTTVGKEFANVAARLQRQIEQLSNVEILGKLNGASGNYNALVFAYPDIDWQVLTQHFITQLGLVWNPYTTQIEPHDALGEFFAILVRINAILIDFNRDLWGYIALDLMKQKSVNQEVGSSTMPHKINPIHFENAEGNLGLANALLQHMMTKLPVSRWQRDLSDSTVLRNMGVAIGHSLLGYQSTSKGLEKIEPNALQLQTDLNQHWEVLGEAIQTMMRRFNLKEPYEQLKAFTRGKSIDQKSLHQFIKALDLDENIKNQLLSLTPDKYVGYAEALGKQI